MVTCLERTDLLTLLYVMFHCVFVTFPCDVMGQVWCLIVSIPDICLYFYFYGVKCQLYILAIMCVALSVVVLVSLSRGTMGWYWSFLLIFFSPAKLYISERNRQNALQMSKKKNWTKDIQRCQRVN